MLRHYSKRYSTSKLGRLPVEYRTAHENPSKWNNLNQALSVEYTDRDPNPHLSDPRFSLMEITNSIVH